MPRGKSTTPLDMKHDDLETDSENSSDDTSDSDSLTEDFTIGMPSDIIDTIIEETGPEMQQERLEKVVQDCIRGKEIARIVYKLTKSKAAYDQAAGQFLQQYLEWEADRTHIVEKLREYADKLDQHHHNVNISNVVGSSAAIAGGVTSIAGILLSPFTFGLSLGLTIAGGATAVSGAVTSLGSSALEYAITKNTNKEVEAMLLKHSKETKNIEDTVKKLVDLYRSREKLLKNEALGEYDIAAVFEVADMVPLANQACSGNTILNTSGVSGKKHVLESVCTLQRTTLSATQPLLVAPAQALRTASSVSTTAVRVTTALHVFGAIGNVVFIGFDIYNVVTTSIDLSKGSKSDSGKKMRETADDLFIQKEAMNEIYTHLKESIA